MYLKSIQQADFLALLSQGSLLLPELMTLVTMEMVYFKEEEHEMKLKETNGTKRGIGQIQKNVYVLCCCLSEPLAFYCKETAWFNSPTSTPSLRHMNAWSQLINLRKCIPYILWKRWRCIFFFSTCCDTCLDASQLFFKGILKGLWQDKMLNFSLVQYDFLLQGLHYCLCFDTIKYKILSPFPMWSFSIWQNKNLEDTDA